jgi:hypothetical protein
MTNQDQSGEADLQTLVSLYSARILALKRLPKTDLSVDPLVEFLIDRLEMLEFLGREILSPTSSSVLSRREFQSQKERLKSVDRFLRENLLTRLKQTLS